MQSATHHSSGARQRAKRCAVPRLIDETRGSSRYRDRRLSPEPRAPDAAGVGDARKTAAAPLRVNGQLAWPTAEIRRLLG